VKPVGPGDKLEPQPGRRCDRTAVAHPRPRLVDVRRNQPRDARNWLGEVPGIRVEQGQLRGTAGRIATHAAFVIRYGGEAQSFCQINGPGEFAATLQLTLQVAATE